MNIEFSEYVETNVYWRLPDENKVNIKKKSETIAQTAQIKIAAMK